MTNESLRSDARAEPVAMVLAVQGAGIGRSLGVNKRESE